MVVICYAFGFFNLNLKIISDGSFKNVSVLCNPLFPLLLDWFFSVLYLHKVPTFFLPSALKGIVYEEEMLIYFSFFVWSLLCDWPSHCLIVSINASYVKAGSMVQLV